MLTDTQLDKYTDVLLWGLKTAKKGKFKRNDIVLIRYDLAATGLRSTLPVWRYTPAPSLGFSPNLHL